MTPWPKTIYLVQHIYLDGLIIHHTQQNLYQTISDQIDKKKTISDQIYKKKTLFEVLCLIWSDIRPGLPLSDLVGNTGEVYCTLQHSYVQYSTSLHYTVQYNILYSTVKYNDIQGVSYIYIQK